MENTDAHRHPAQSQDYTKTDINGFPARYVLTKHPSDPENGYILAKVLDIPLPELFTTDVSESTHATHPPNPCVRLSIRFIISARRPNIYKTNQSSSSSIASEITTCHIAASTPSSIPSPKRNGIPPVYSRTQFARL